LLRIDRKNLPIISLRNGDYFLFLARDEEEKGKNEKKGNAEKRRRFENHGVKFLGVMEILI
jgi:hypothetical protein